MATTNWSGKPHLALLSGNEEDRFTRFLYELLQSRTVLDSFVSLVGQKINLRPPVDASTSPRIQATIPKGRLDLAVCGGSLYLLFEAKLGSCLHKDQLTPYAHAVSEWQKANTNGISALLVLTPEQSLPFTMDTGINQLKQAGLSHVRLAGISWEQIRLCCQDLKEKVDDLRLRFHLKEFADLIEYRLGDSPRPFTLEEAKILDDRLIAKLIRSTRDIVKLVSDGLKADPSYTTKRESTRDLEYYGFEITHNGRTWWYGIWTEVWAKVGRSPIFLQLHGWKNQNPETTQNDLPEPSIVPIGQHQEVVVPIPVCHGIAIDDVVIKQITVIKRYIDTYPRSGKSRT